MIDAELQRITETDLLRLIDAPVLEGDRIEYKIDLKLGTDDEKKKFLATVASFANASGGDIIFGMHAEKGQPLRLQALPGLNADATCLRIRDLVRTGIAPAVFTVEARPIPLESGGEVLVVRVRKTWAGAHMVTFNGDNRFYTRHGGGRRPMEVAEIQGAFTWADRVMDSVQRFRLERIAHILAGETPCDVGSKATLVFQIVPVRAFDPSFSPDLRAIERMQTRLRPLMASGWGTRREFDGIYVVEGSGIGATSGYIHVSRNGILEVVDTATLGANGESRRIASVAFEQDLIDGLPEWLSALRAVGAEPPVVLMLTFLNVRGYSMAVDIGVGGFSAHAISRDHLHVPATVLESLTVHTDEPLDSSNVFTALKPHLDAIWNACGYAGSIYFDQEGRWIGPRR